MEAKALDFAAWACCQDGGAQGVDVAVDDDHVAHAQSRQGRPDAGRFGDEDSPARELSACLAVALGVGVRRSHAA